MKSFHIQKTWVIIDFKFVLFPIGLKQIIFAIWQPWPREKGSSVNRLYITESVFSSRVFNLRRDEVILNTNNFRDKNEQYFNLNPSGLRVAFYRKSSD